MRTRKASVARQGPRGVNGRVRFRAVPAQENRRSRATASGNHDGKRLQEALGQDGVGTQCRAEADQADGARRFARSPDRTEWSNAASVRSPNGRSPRTCTRAIGPSGIVRSLLGLWTDGDPECCVRLPTLAVTTSWTFLSPTKTTTSRR
jgi:hypothetical protein